MIGGRPHPLLSRRGALAGTASLLAAAGARAAPAAGSRLAAAAPADEAAQIVPFLGAHQAGILTPAQRHTCFAAFDVVAGRREDVAALLRRWTEAAYRLSTGTPLAAPSAAAPAAAPGAASSAAPGADYAATAGADYAAAPSADAAGADAGDTLGLPPSRLTVTFGFGATLFVRDGTDRFGLAKKRPAALVDLPSFPGDQLQPARSNGDLSVQACADDPVVAMHAVRELARLADGTAELRWLQNGFTGNFRADETPRNLMGFKDGTNNPATADAAAMNDVVWVGSEGPDWMRGGSYLVYRRARIALEHWDRMTTAFQEQTVGRRKVSGAPLGGRAEHDAPDYAATDTDGNPLIPENSHIRLAAAENNDGARMLRRGYSYNDGANFVAERWPPWKQGMEFDAGLLFIAYQRDPRTAFIRIFERMAKFDMMNQFVTNTASALFACPPGAGEDAFIGQALFDAV